MAMRSVRFGAALATATFSILAFSGSAQAQDVASFTDHYGFDVGDATSREFVDGLWVSLRIVQQQFISGQDMVYARAEFCNNSGTQVWRGGISVAEEEPSRAHTTFRVDAGGCRTWSEWVPRNVTQIWVFAEQAE